MRQQVQSTVCSGIIKHSPLCNLDLDGETGGTLQLDAKALQRNSIN